VGTDEGSTASGEPDADDGLVVDDLTVRYQGTPDPAISGVSLAVAPGSGLCVTGDEGSGKTTLIRAVVGLVAPGRGSVVVRGGSPRLPEIRRQIGYGPERLPFPRGMRVIDAVRLVASIRGAAPGGVNEALTRAGLEAGDRRTITSLDLGDIRRTSLACAIVGRPPVLALDDPWEFEETVTVITEAMDDGATVIVASPDPGGFPQLLGRTLTLDPGVPE
jgi:ABC-type multidrug transport system ATPase subunit